MDGHMLPENEYLNSLKEILLDKDNWREVIMSREWATSIPAKAGVYVFKENEKIVYVGETGNLRGRMTDILDTRNHTLRRSIGKRFYSGEFGYVDASGSNKFPSHIEELVNMHICTRFRLAFVAVSLGRKELEELIEKELDRDGMLNKRGKRK